MTLGAEREAAAVEETIEGDERPDTIVLASGNLGLIYMPREPKRLTREGFEDKHPGLITTLATHPGVGFVCLDTERRRSGRDRCGRQALPRRRPHRGRRPARALRQARRAPSGAQLRFKNAPDIYVVSMYDPASGEVAAFEELVGSHGGLGGTQSEPFAFVPSEWSEEPDEIIGAGEMHDVLVRWLAESGLRPTPGESAA